MKGIKVNRIDSCSIERQKEEITCIIIIFKISITNQAELVSSQMLLYLCRASDLEFLERISVCLFVLNCMIEYSA